MGNISETINQYMRSELMVLVPVLWIFVKLLHQSAIDDKHILWILSVISISLCAVYTFATAPSYSVGGILMCIFSCVTQGLLYVGATIFGAMMIDSINKK